MRIMSIPEGLALIKNCYDVLVDFKEDIRKSEGAPILEMVWGSNHIYSKELVNITVGRKLTRLCLRYRAVYLLRYLIGKYTSYIEVDEIFLMHNYSDIDLEKELENRYIQVKNLEFVRAMGFDSIKQVLRINSSDGPIQKLELSNDTTMPNYDPDHSLEESVNASETIRRFNYNELYIKGDVQFNIIKEIYYISGALTKQITIECNEESSNKLIKQKGLLIRKKDALKKIILKEFSYRMAMLGEVGDFILVNGKVETLSLVSEDALIGGQRPKGKVEIIKCQHLELHGRVINILSVLGDATLKEVETVGILYKDEDIYSDMDIGYSEAYKVREILKSNQNPKLTSYRARNTQYPDSPSDRLKEILSGSSSMINLGWESSYSSKGDKIDTDPMIEKDYYNLRPLKHSYTTLFFYSEAEEGNIAQYNDQEEDAKAGKRRNSKKKIEIICIVAVLVGIVIVFWIVIKTRGKKKKEVDYSDFTVPERGSAYQKIPNSTVG
eukprot:GHVP01051845.1.p1 GENE.GHVP01051845.1~~GHVP01051845.1.p1  ORF type:complete len:496 (-),score=68.39 GHVP01051845.1:153-1640(-)